MAEKVKMLIPEEEVNARIEELGKKISEEYAGKQVHLICVLKGGVFFMCELAKRITVPVTMDFMSVSSYGDGTQSSGIVKIAKDLDESLEGKDVIVVEDIVDSGRTLYYLLDILRKRGPKSMKLCTLLDKPDRRVRDLFIWSILLRLPFIGFSSKNKLYSVNIRLQSFAAFSSSASWYRSITVSWAALKILCPRSLLQPCNSFSNMTDIARFLRILPIFAHP